MSKRGYGRGFGAAPVRLAAGVLARGRALAAGLSMATLALAASPALAAELVGQPTPGGVGLQPGVTAIRHEAAFFHDWILLPIIIGISLFVLALLVYIVIRFNAKANPTPDRFTHNTTIEIIWTAAPVLILMFIAIFSFRLLFDYHNEPKPDVTIKATGNQWYWAYEYPSAGVPEYTSNPLPEAKAEAKGKGLYRLAVDNPIVVPVNKNIQVLATGADVLHAFFIPAFGVQTTTIPGRINQVWFRAEKTGTYYGQCNELCGVNHSFMPIEVDVVTQPEYEAWLSTHAKKPAAAPSTVATAAPAGGASAQTTPAAGPTTSGAPAAPAAAPASTPASTPAA